MVESVHQHHSSVPVPGHRRILPHHLFAPPLQWPTLTPSCHQLSPSPKKTQRGFIIADKLLKWIEYAYKIAFYLKSYMKSHSCLQWIDKTIISSIYLFSPIRTNTLRVFWPRCSLGEGPIPAHFEDCSLDHCGGSLGCLWRITTATRTEMAGPSRQSTCQEMRASSTCDHSSSRSQQCRSRAFPTWALPVAHT